jgi:peptide/nickel transport system substrate-binding protein
MTEGVPMSSTIDRRQFLAHSAAAAGGAVVAGAVADVALPGAAGAATKRKITKGGTLTVGVASAQHKPFTPDYAQMDTAGFCLARAIYDPLFVTSSDSSTVYPYLAASITHNAAYTSWTITMREGVKFHDGTPCNGDAAYANVVADRGSLLTGSSLAALIESTSHTPGSQSFTINTKFKWTTFPFTLAEQQVGFVAAPSTLGASYTGNPIGTGPFIFEGWNASQGLNATANANYWRAGLPYLGKITFTVIPDGPSRLQALQSGEVDMIHETDGSDLKSFSSLGSGYTWMTDAKKPSYSPNANCIQLNVKAKPFNNLDLRRACASAIDRQQFATVIDKGVSSPIDGIFLPSSPFYKNPGYPSYSPSTARKYAKKVPKADRTFTLQCVNDNGPITAGAELVASFLSDVGITATLDPIEQATLIDNAIGHNYQAMTWSQFGGVTPDLNFPWFGTDTGLNFANNLDPSIQAAMIAGMGATTVAARHAAWAKVNSLLAKDLPYLWLDRTVWGTAAQASVQNWKSFTAPGGQAVLQPNGGVIFYTEIWKS